MDDPATTDYSCETCKGFGAVRPEPGKPYKPCPTCHCSGVDRRKVADLISRVAPRRPARGREP